MEPKRGIAQALEFIASEYPGVLFLLNAEGEVIRFSEASLALYGYAADEMFGMKFANFIADEEAVNSGALCGSAVEYHQRKDGRPILVEKKCCSFDDHHEHYTLVTVRSMIAQPLDGDGSCLQGGMDRAFVKDDAALCARYEAIASGIIVYDPKGQVVFANRILERLLNCSWFEVKANCLQSSTWSFVDEGGERVRADDFPSSQSIATQRPVHNKILGLKRASTESIQWLLVNSTPVFDSKTHSLAEVIVTINDITVLHNAAKVLQESEQRLIFALESIHAGEWELNPTDMRVRYSSRCAEIFRNQAHSELAYAPWQEVAAYFHAEDRDMIYQIVRAAIERREAFDATGRILRSDGAKRWIQIAGRPVEMDEKMVSLSGIVVDITEKKLAAASRRQVLLRTHEVVVKEVVESFGLLHFVLDCNLTYLAFNKAQMELMQQLFGAEIAVGENYLSYVNIDAKKTLMERNLRRALAGEVFTFEHYFILKGKGIQCLVAIYCPIRDEVGQILGVSVFAYDASNTKSAQAILHDREYRYRKSVEESNLIFLQLNPQGEFVYLNRYGCELFEYDLTELTGKKLIEILVPNSASLRIDLKRFLPRVLRRRFSGTRRRVCELTTRSLKRVWVEWSYHWALAADGGAPTLVAAGLDITREMQARLEERRAWKRHRRQEVLNEAVTGKLSTAEFARLARIYQIPLDYPMLCLVLRPAESRGTRDFAAFDETKESFVDSFAGWMQGWTEGLVWRSADGVCALLSAQGEASGKLEVFERRQTEKLLHQAAFYMPDIFWRAGVSSAASSAMTMAELYFQARAALLFGPVIMGARVYYVWRDLGSYQLLLNDLKSERTARFIDEQLGPLLAMENKDTQQELISTIRELASFDSDEKIAQRLHIHRRTVRYRKLSLAKLLQRDLDRAKNVVDLSIAVSLWEAQKYL